MDEKTKFSFAEFFADPMKKKIFLVTVVSILVVGAIVVAIVLGGKGKDKGDGSFLGRPQTVETDEAGNPVTQDSTGNSSETTKKVLQTAGADTNDNFGELIRPGQKN